MDVAAVEGDVPGFITGVAGTGVVVQSGGAGAGRVGE